MALHLIPRDNAPHAPTTECGCGVQRTWSGRYRRWVFEHQAQR